MEHLGILDNSLVGEAELGEQLAAGPLVDEIIYAGNEKEHGGAQASRQLLGSALFAQDAHQAGQAAGAELAGVGVHDRLVGGIAGAHGRREGNRDRFFRVEEDQCGQGQVGRQRELQAVLEVGGDQDQAVERRGLTADRVESDQPADALAEEKKLTAGVFGRDRFPKRQDVAFPDAERVDVTARPIGRQSAAAEFNGIRGIAGVGEILGEESPAGRVRSQTVDEKERGLGRPVQRPCHPLAVKDIGTDEFRHGRDYTKSRPRPETLQNCARFDNFVEQEFRRGPKMTGIKRKFLWHDTCFR